jgi:hypothetical protein
MTELFEILVSIYDLCITCDQLVSELVGLM